jgi:hypothetical protein
MFIDEFNLNNVIQSMTSMQTKNDEVFLLLVGEHTNWNAEEFVHVANSRGLRFFGGIFPFVISGGNKYEKGIVIKKFAAEISPVLQLGLNLSNFEMQNLNHVKSKLNKRTAIIMVDGLSTQIARLLEKLYSVLGDSVNYIGGGAGSLSFVQKPSVFCNQGIFQDAAVIAFVDSDASMGVKHGWEKVYGPLVATKTDRNIIQELNWENPFDVYKKVIFEDSGKQIEPDNFFSIAKSFPFGISKEHSEYVVRDPLTVNSKGELVCVGEVFENAVLDILKGEPDTLVKAAKDAALQAVNYAGKFSSVLLVDCISRALFLESDFSYELEGVSSVLKENSCDLEIEGVLSLGEISSAGQGYLEFFNKTILISLFHE